MNNRVRFLFWGTVTLVVGTSSFILVKLLLAIRERQRQGSCRTLFYRLFTVQVWGVMMHSLVRFAYICSPRLHLQLDRIPGPAWFLLNTLVPFAVFARFLLQVDPVSFRTNEDGYAAIWAPMHVVHSNACQSTIVTVIGSVFSASCYLFVLRQLVRLRQIQDSSATDFRHERSLTVV
ncbi:hypothetical protein PRIPAC_90217 [Pristionchus pacificus]|uniref:Uncharacterized protein n=1 Tax=Pristionchus pacificus TaxID=54126 RepID=A0A2A6B3N1_PRIPA|nr:hypothetical protein PRIPAC_90217 [Pristionchus pacificus]|eukprot:PDM60482.1 hypothetical protein PRIPAC_53460 [Pristionchus pacificus]